MFLTPEETGGPMVFALRQHNRYLAIEALWGFVPEPPRSTTANTAIIEKLTLQVREFDIEQLATVLERSAGETWQEHASLILLACCGGRLFEWLDKVEEARPGTTRDRLETPGGTQ